MRHLAQTRNLKIRGDIELPGSTLSRRPGMTVKKLLRRLAMGTREPQQRVVVHGLDRREVAVSNYIRTPTRPDYIAHRDFTPIQAWTTTR